MRAIFVFWSCLLMASNVPGKVLIVADELPAMEVLAGHLQKEEKIESKIISQTELPSNLELFDAIVVYIHGALGEKTETGLINYTEAGGKLVLLHHSISSGKRKNTRWFSFLGVSLPNGSLAEGGYKWIEGVTFDLINLQPNHFVMTNKVNYPKEIPGADVAGVSGARKLPGFRLEHTEVYLNHVHTEPRTLLMGLQYTDAVSGKTYTQKHAGWMKPAGRGHVLYFMPGHTKEDFENPTYGRIVINAIIYHPSVTR